MELPQRRAGVGAQLGCEPAAQPVVMRECVGLPSAAVEGQQVLPRHAFVQWFRGRRRGEESQRLPDPAGGQQQIGPIELGGPPLGLPLLADLIEPRRVEAAERPAAPEAEGLVE